MRFMMVMIPNVSDESWEPNPDDIATMSKYNDELAKAGVLLTLDGLTPPSKGARVSFADGKPSVTDGPFTEAKELIGGYWLIQARSKEEAVEWATRCPAPQLLTVASRMIPSSVARSAYSPRRPMCPQSRIVPAATPSALALGISRSRNASSVRSCAADSADSVEAD